MKGVFLIPVRLRFRHRASTTLSVCNCSRRYRDAFIRRFWRNLPISHRNHDACVPRRMDRLFPVGVRSDRDSLWSNHAVAFVQFVAERSALLGQIGWRRHAFGHGGLADNRRFAWVALQQASVARSWRREISQEWTTESKQLSPLGED
jgi:hypothetical protein